jgi:ABC-type phosphate transport system substrate-binding protein
MLKNKKLRVGAVAAAAAALALVTCAAVPAFADPTAGSFKNLSGVGSDTIQDVMNGMASQISDIGSYDAVDPATGAAGGQIQTKAGTLTFTRPNGSGDGVKALSASIQGGSHQWANKTIKDQVDFARSSSGPSVTGTDLVYVPFARDAVTYAVPSGSDWARNIPTGSAADPANKLSLYNIYHCIKTSYTDSNGDPVAIKPLVPQSGSGTAKFWASTLSFDDGALPSCVKRVNNEGVAVQEHDGSTLTDPGNIVPFSIAQYIAQGNHTAIAASTGVNVVERKGQVVLGSINGQSPFRMSGGKTVMNAQFPVTRLVYNVVSAARAADTNDKVNTTFIGASSAVCSHPEIITQFGFSTISNCGATNVTGGFTV